MKEQIIIYYKKDKSHTNDYIVKRILTQENDYYSVKSYYMINSKLKEYTSRLKLHITQKNNYLLQCKKSAFFEYIEYQNIMEV